MKTMPPSVQQNSHPAVAGDATACWRLIVVAGPEDSLVLARALQKLAVPEIELRRVQFETGGFGDPTRLELTFHARAERARLAAVRMEKLHAVRSVTLRPMPGG